MYYFQFSILINNAAIDIFLCRGDCRSELFPQSFASALLLPHPPPPWSQLPCTSPASGQSSTHFSGWYSGCGDGEGRHWHCLVPSKFMFSSLSQPLLQINFLLFFLCQVFLLFLTTALSKPHSSPEVSEHRKLASYFREKKKERVPQVRTPHSVHTSPWTHTAEVARCFITLTSKLVKVKGGAIDHLVGVMVTRQACPGSTRTPHSHWVQP